MRAPIKEVSALAQVSTKTVSRVLNKERYVSDEVRARVERPWRNSTSGDQDMLIRGLGTITTSAGAEPTVSSPGPARWAERGT